MFFFVIQVGVARNDGTLPLPLFVVPLVFGLPPARSATATATAPFASTLAGLYTVPDCQPEMMFCAPCAVASWPDSGTAFSFLALSAVTTAFASPSFAAARRR